MHKFVRSLLTEWRKLGLPFSDETFVVAVSGGADSVSLALALNELERLGKLNLRFVIAHFNHNLRGEESDEDERFIRNFAENFDFELACGKIQNPESTIENQIGNLEQNARFARYDFLRQTAENLRAFGILTAHTLNDQAETFLLNLIRGSGLEGLGGIKTVRDFELHIPDSKNENLQSETEDFQSKSNIQNPTSKILLVRPLLKWARREATENFCRENKIEFRSDSMNENLAFRRVRIRKVLLPLLEDFNPKIVETLAKTANLLQEDFSQIKNSANFAAGNFQWKEPNSANILNLKEFKNLFPSMRRQILREWLKNCRGGLQKLDSKHLEAIENLIRGRRSGRTIELPNGETVIKRQGKLFFEKTKVEKSRTENYNQGLDFTKGENAIENND
jgi:tRNA(Ile)-lysidine synthase